MSYTRHKTDSNQSDIVKQLRTVPGLSVESRLAQLGHGCGDLLIGWCGKNYLYEVKPSDKAKLTTDEKKWHSNWNGRILRANCVEDILRDLGIMV